MVPVLLAGLAGLTSGLLIYRLRQRWVLITVDGPSMLPTLTPGERILVRRTPASEIRTGEVVVAEYPDTGRWLTPPLTRPLSRRGAPGAGRRWIVKRAVAGPGDPLPTELVATPGDPGVARVPAGHYVLLGDNRRQSVDSRVFGLVPGDRILGPVRRGRPAGSPNSAPDRATCS